MNDELDVTNYDLEAERTARREADERSTKAIRDCVGGSGLAGQRGSDLADKAFAELAAILKRIEEQETQIAVMREAITGLLAGLEGELFARGGGMVDDVGDYLKEELAAARSALTPDTGKRVVDVEWLQEIEWSATENVSGLCPACFRYDHEGHVPDCWLAKLIGPVVEMADWPIMWRSEEVDDEH